MKRDVKWNDRKARIFETFIHQTGKCGSESRIGQLLGDFFIVEIL
jgi:hypothetical protein